MKSQYKLATKQSNDLEVFDNMQAWVSIRADSPEPSYGFGESARNKLPALLFIEAFTHLTKIQNLVRWPIYYVV